MNKITFIGDVHGKISQYQRMLLAHMEPTIQLGDMGVGFKGIETSWLEDKDVWIHGNHDNPDLCATQKGYLGRYGITNQGIFYVSGGFSVDAFYRNENIDWWHNEQLSLQEFEKALELYEKVKPEIVATHDCPRFMYDHMLALINKPRGPIFENNTASNLDKLYKIHQPKLWVYGHWHVPTDIVVDKTRFVCLGELQKLTVEI